MKDLKVTKLLTVLLFLIVVGHTETAYGLNSLSEPDSCICYTDTMDMKALECIKNRNKNDSIMANNNQQLLNLKERIAGKDTILSDNLITITKLEDENQKINLHLSRAKRNKNIFGFGGLGIGIIGTLLLLK
jgi:hypothetical protein